jgi:hypothetical protein
VALVDEPRDDVRVLQVEVVVAAEDVGGDDGRELAAMLGCVEAVLQRGEGERVEV